MTIRLLLLTITILTSRLAATAQPACHVRTFNIHDGLPANVIAGIEQDKKGLMWLATWNGLCCYDGYQFTTFKDCSQDSINALPTSRIAMIRTDSRGNIWLRTYDAKLYLYDTYSCRYVNVGHLLEEQYQQPFKPRNFYPMPSGHTWITGEGGTLNLRIDDRYPTDASRMEVYSTKGHEMLGSYIKKVEADREGQEWIITDRSVIRYGDMPLNTPLTKDYATKLKIREEERNSFIDSKKRTWHFTNDNNIELTEQGETRRLTCDIPAVYTRSDKSLWTEDRNGTVWLATKGGCFCYYDEEARQLVPYVLQGTGANGTVLTHIDKYFLDMQGNLWFSSSHGLTLVNFRYYRMRRLPLVQNELTRSVLWRKDGTVWAGTSDGYIGIYTTNGQQTGWLDAKGNISSNRVKMADRIYALFEDSKGCLWIGTKGSGLYVVTPQKTVNHYMPNMDDPYAISHAFIYTIDEDRYGRIWIGTFGGGLNLVEQQESGALRFINSKNGLKGYPQEGFEKIRRISHDRNGCMLITTTSGLLTTKTAPTGNHFRFFATYHRQGDTTTLKTSDVMQALASRNGSIYIATLGGGIQKLKDGDLLKDNLQLQSIDVLNKGVGNVLSMTEDHLGRIWIARETGIDCYEPTTGRVTQYGPSSMAQQVELTEALPATDGQGRIWMGANGGILAFDSREMRKDSYQPHIVFTGVRYQGDPETLPILNRQTLEVDPHQRSLTVYFAALDYEDNYLMQYAYKIAGKNSEWNYIGTKPGISFSQLPPGEHTLIVKSTNCDGVWADNETELRISVKPMLWERTWVQLLTLLITIILATAAVLTYLRHRQKNKEREQRLENILRQYRELQQTLSEKPSGEQPQQEVSHRYLLEQPPIVNADDEMMEQLMKFIEQRISDEELKVEEMAESVNMGRTAFYEKIRELVGVSPSDFLRHIRMQRARELVTHSKLTISEIAYSVGFTDPKYFSKCFKKETGMTPSEYRDKQPSLS